MLALTLLLACAARSPQPEASSPEPAPEPAPEPSPEPASSVEVTPTSAPGPCAESEQLPEAWRAHPLGTPLAAFEASGIEATRSEHFTDFRTTLVVAPPQAGDPETTLYFDVDLEGQPLYEYIFVYPEGTDVVAVAEALWGPTNDSDRWALDVEGCGVTLSAWTFDSTIVIIAPWKGTEWDSE